MARYYPPGGGTGGSGSSVDLDQITVPRRLVPSGYKTLTNDSIGEIVEGTLPLLKGTAFGDSSNVVGVAFESSPIKLAVNNNAVAGFDYVLDGYFDDTVNGTMTRVHIPNCIPSNIAAGIKVGGKNAYLTGTFTADATGIASDIKSGKTAYVNGALVTGSMPVRAAINSTINAGGSVEIPEGYYPAGKITAKSLADQTKATAVANHILKDDTAWIDGVLVTGTMPNIASIDAVKSLYDKAEVSTLFARISKGAHITDASSGYPEVSIPYATVVSATGITADKIAAGNSIFGVAGTFSSDANAVAEDLREGKKAYVNGQLIVGTAKVVETTTIAPQAFSGTSSNQYSMAFERSLSSPPAGITVRDVSQAKNNSVVCWADTTSNKYYWYSDADIVYLPEMSFFLFTKSKYTSIDLSGLDGSKIDIIQGMFENCTNLRTVNFGDLKIENVIRLDDMFKNCTSLTSVDMHGFDTSNTTSIRSMFEGCSKLQSLDLSSFNMSKCIYYNNAFLNCSSMTSINLSGWHLGDEYTEVENMFKGCSSLISINLSNWITSQIEVFCGMFDGCSSLRNLDLSSFDTGNGSDFKYMFRDCTSLINITYGNAFTFGETVTGTFGYLDVNDTINRTYHMYYNAPAQKRRYSEIYRNYCYSNEGTLLKIKDATFAEGTVIQKAINPLAEQFIPSDQYPPQSAALTNISSTGDERIVTWYDSNNRIQYYYTAVPTKTLINTNASNMFSGCASLKNVDLSNIYLDKTQSLYDFSHMFDGCKNLESFTIDWWKDSATGIYINTSCMFRNCSKITDFSFVKNINYQTGLDITDTSHMFQNCTSLSTVAFTNCGIYENKNASHMFEGCTSLENIIDIYMFSDNENISYAFKDCISLSETTLSDILNYFLGSETKNVSHMMHGCLSLRSVSFEDGGLFELRCNIEDASYMFYGCANLQSISFQRSYEIELPVESKIKNIQYMFGGCSQLSSISNIFRLNSDQRRKYCLTKDSSNMTYMMFSGCKNDIIETVKSEWLDYEFVNNLFYPIALFDTSWYVQSYMINHLVRSQIPPQNLDNCNVLSYTNNEILAWYDATTGTQYFYSPYDKLYIKEIITSYSSFTLIDLTNLTNVTDALDFSFLDVSYITDASYAFSDVKASSLNLTGWNTHNFVNMKNMFSYCEVPVIDIRHFDTSNVTNMSNMFSDCKCKTVDLSGLNVSKVTNMTNMFAWAEQLSSLKLSGWNTSSVITMDNMFCYCAMLTSIDLSGFDTSKVTDMSYMFLDCTKLSNVTYGNKFIIGPNFILDSSGSNTTYGMFNNCPANKPTWTGGTWNSSGTFIRS